MVDQEVVPGQVIDRTPYKFFVAGHVYGDPVEATDSVGLYPPFYRKLPEISADKSIEFGVFTGDIVKWNEAFRWDSVDHQIARHNLEVYMVPGNHDVDVGKDYENWHARYGPSYYSFRRHSDLFLFLDPNLDHWRISGDQLEMVKRELHDLAHIENIFVFTHQVLWWNPNPDSLFYRTYANSTDGRQEPQNFWTEVLPLFQPLSQEVYFFAGDVGAWCWRRSVTSYDAGHIHLMTSGMGCLERSNYLEVSVNSAKRVNIRLVALGPAGENSMGSIRNHKLRR